jgi:hypothetical protein
LVRTRWLWEYTSLPHIIDADKLRLSNSRRKQGVSQKATAWQKRAKAIEEYFGKQFNCTPEKVEKQVDQLLKHPDYMGLQRQNPLGTAFSGIAKHVLELFGNNNVSFDLEVDANNVFPGITLPGRSITPSIDILAHRNNIPLAIISAKWSLRHDRINDITNECPIYKAAALRSRTKLGFYVVSNEYDPSRLSKILNDTCIDGLVHVHKEAVTKICGLNGRLEKMLDLTDLIHQTNNW